MSISVMKKLFAIFVAMCSLAIGCQRFDYNAVLDQLRDHENRIEQLETECKRLNSNIEAMQALLQAVQSNDYVTEVTKLIEDGIEVGYSIRFAKGGAVTIYHGSKGEDGAAPKIGIQKASDGGYYWTSDGEWLTDENGEKIPAVYTGSGDGSYITPLFRVSEDIWYVSYDNGNSWKEIGRIPDEEENEEEEEVEEELPIFSEVTYDSNNAYFTLADGTVLCLPLKSEELVELYQEAKNYVSRFQHQAYMNQKNTNENLVDIVLFAGQSNSCGRAQLTDCTTEEDLILEVPMNCAFSFNNTASTEPLQIVEPITANGTSGYGYIPAFINSYHATTNRKICACYKSVGGTMINKFVPYVLDDLTGEPTTTKGTYYKQMVSAVQHAQKNIVANGYEVGEVLLVWCQGESEAYYLGYENQYAITYEEGLTTDEQKIDWYKKQFLSLFDALKADVGLSAGFIIRIGHRKSDEVMNIPIIQAQSELGKEVEDVVLVSTLFAGAKYFIKEDGSIRNLMRDQSHYFPEGYARTGLEAGVNAGIYINSGKMIKPILLEYNTLTINDTNVYERPVDKFLYDPCRVDFNTLKK